MATSTDPRASGFDEAGFRDAIKFAMKMGQPNAVEDQVTFIWPVVRTYAHGDDAAGRTYDWTAVPTSETPEVTKVVDCAVEFAARPTGTHDTPVGQFDMSRVIITLMDSDYAQVKTASLVKIGGNTYDIEFVGEPIGMFGVTFYQIYADAQDES